MKILAAALLISLATVVVAGAGEFDFNSHIGTVDSSSKGELCLTITNGDVAEGSRVQIVNPDNPQTVASAIVRKKLTGSCSRNPNSDSGDSFYSLKLVEGRV